ncbi:MAG: tol-pal system protein YbgF [Hyphomicrobium sp.]
MTAETQQRTGLGFAAVMAAVHLVAASSGSAVAQDAVVRNRATARPVELAQAQPKAGGQSGAAAGQAAATQKRAPAKPQGQGDAAAAPSGGDAGLRQRVEALEEQLVDLQVVIGTLESLAKSGGGSAAAAPAWRSGGASSGADQARLEGVETQIRALTAQIEQLSGQGRQVSGGGGGSAAAASPPPSRRTDVAGFRAPEPQGSSASGFGSTVVTPGGADSDAIGGLIAGQSGAQQGGAQPPATRQPAALAPSAASDAGAKQLYETAYGHLLQQDYGAAESAFDDFIKRYPSDGLAGNAQYWLGESHYVRGQYKAAAGAFLKGYQTYGRSAKAPDSLLKLAMSLERLGQKDQACLSYGELGTKFPNAPAHVKARAQSERQRIGCS